MQNRQPPRWPGKRPERTLQSPTYVSEKNNNTKLANNWHGKYYLDEDLLIRTGSSMGVLQP